MRCSPLVRPGLVTALLTFVPACDRTVEAVVGTAVKTAKDTAKGIERGVEQGRKAGASTDDAVIVTKTEELVGKGSITVLSVADDPSGEGRARVELAVNNETDRPIRLSGLDLLGLDKDGFSQDPTSAPAEVTVPPEAKEKIVLTFDVPAEALAKIRVWQQELPLSGGG